MRYSIIFLIAILFCAGAIAQSKMNPVEKSFPFCGSSINVKAYIRGTRFFLSITSQGKTEEHKLGEKLKKEEVKKNYTDFLQKPANYPSCSTIQVEYEKISFFAQGFVNDLLQSWYPDPVLPEQMKSLNDDNSLVLIKFPSNKWSISLFDQKADISLPLIRYEPASRTYVINETNIEGSNLVKKNFSKFIVLLNGVKSSEKPALLLQLQSDRSYILAVSYDGEIATLTSIHFSAKIGNSLLDKPVNLKISGTESTLFSIKPDEAKPDGNNKNAETNKLLEN
ncbi:MAG TPA: hypothetical protein VK772_12865 [Puia sp.]|jgi:hypothetical protein|nr:hypothetical protein [Puia sp.]